MNDHNRSSVLQPKTYVAGSVKDQVDNSSTLLLGSVALVLSVLLLAGGLGANKANVLPCALPFQHDTLLLPLCLMQTMNGVDVM